jgi:maltooligosyltrehalose trehalohydrolase
LIGILARPRKTHGCHWSGDCSACATRKSRLSGAAFGDAKASDNGLLTAHWRMDDGTTLHLVANLSEGTIAHPDDLTGTPIWGGETGSSLPPWSVVWRLGG